MRHNFNSCPFLSTVMGSNILLSPSFIRSSMGILHIDRKQQINTDVVILRYFFNFIRRLRSSIFIFDVPPLVIANDSASFSCEIFCLTLGSWYYRKIRHIYFYNLEQQIYLILLQSITNFVMYKMRWLWEGRLYIWIWHFFVSCEDWKFKTRNPFDYWWWRPWCVVASCSYEARTFRGTFRNAY
jgi:hypothetical protein